MNFDKLEKEYLINLLKEKVNKSFTEDLNNFSVSVIMVKSRHKGVPTWEINNFEVQRKKMEKLCKLWHSHKRRLARSILKKVRNPKQVRK